MRHPARFRGMVPGSRAGRVRGLALSLAVPVALVPALAGCGGSGGGAAPTRTTSTTAPSALVSIGAGLRGPTGLRATVYATGLANASAFSFDRLGRLWVTTSAAAGHRDDGVWLVARAGAKPVKVVAGLRGPLGLTWLGDTLYVASIGRVDAFSGLRGERFAHRRTVLREPAGHGWNDNLIVTPGGRLLMSISTPCDHCRSRSRFAAAIVTFRPDGSRVRTYARDVRAGYGLAYLPGSDDLLVSMNQRDDLGTRTPGDWLALVRAGQDWRFPGCYGQGGSACTGVPAPLSVLDQHAAAGGVAVVAGGVENDVGTAALVAEWARGKVMRVALTRSGSSYAPAPATTFLTGFKSPLALATTSDGAVLVGDWASGTIYRVAPG